jgi:hypothetical protein
MDHRPQELTEIFGANTTKTLLYICNAEPPSNSHTKLVLPASHPECGVFIPQVMFNTSVYISRLIKNSVIQTTVCEVLSF